MLFQAILLRVTGRVQRYTVYQNFMKEVMKEDVSQLPRCSSPDVDLFTAFVRAELGPTKHSISHWMSDQHKGQIPSALGDVDAFVSFLTKLQARLAFDMKESVLKQDPRGRPKVERSMAFNALKKTLTQCVEANEEDVAFVAQAVMLDVEEIYQGVFQEATPAHASLIVGGPGSDLGLAVMKNSSEVESLEDAVKKMLSAMNGQSQEYLACFGAKKNQGESFARWKINNRPLNIYDMEHFLCKVSTDRVRSKRPAEVVPRLPMSTLQSHQTLSTLVQIYVTVAHTFGNRCFSGKPFASKPHCWPLKIPNNQLDSHEYWLTIAKDAIDAFRELNGNGSFQIPDLCFLRGEKEEREAAITEPQDLHALVHTAIAV